MSLENAILATLAYHSIFSYPLKASEIHQYLIGKKTSDTQEQKALSSLLKKRKIGKEAGHYFIKKNTVALRRKREKASIRKLRKTKLYITLLRLIPTIKLIAITGALSMNNSTESDDVDFLIITSKNTLWTTRLVCNLILFPFKRSPNKKTQRNKACLNIFIDEQELQIKEKNLYTAHEITQMKIMINRSNTYQKFVKQNQWVNKYLPNWKSEKGKRQVTSNKSYSEIALVFSPFALVLEKRFKSFQLKYMQRKITTETIGQYQLFFHPLNTQLKILKEYEKKLKLLTKKDSF